MKWEILVAAMVALLIVETFSLPTPKDKKDNNEKDIGAKDKNEKDVSEEDKDGDEKDADEEDKDEEDKDGDEKDADEKDKDWEEIKSKPTKKTAKKKKASTKNTKAKGETDKKEKAEEENTDNIDLGNVKVKKKTDKKKKSKKDSNKVKTEVTIDIKERKKTITKDEKTEETEETIVDEKQEKISNNTVDEYKEGISEEEVYMDDDYVKDDLGAEAVKGNEKNLIEDMDDDLYLPISGRLKSAMLPESDRVMDEPDFLPRAEAVMDEPAEGSVKQRAEERHSIMPTAERVMMAQETGTKPGGDGKMKMNLNLKDLDENPSDLTVGAAAVGLMSQAVKSKGPDDNQVNAVAGFGHQIMGLVSELEKDTK